MADIYREKVVVTLTAIEAANLLGCLLSKPNTASCWLEFQCTGVGTAVRFTEAGETEGSDRTTDITDYSAW